MAILFVGGVNDRGMIGVTLDEKGNLLYVVDGNCSLDDRLQLEKGVAFKTTIFGLGVPQRMLSFKSAPSLIFNQIADADTHQGALQRCVELCKQVDAPVINHPEYVLETTRDQVARKLSDIPGVVMPRTLRFQPRSPDEALALAAENGFEFPFIIRTTGDHNGRNVVKLDNQENLPELHALPFDGRDFYLLEYIDYRDSDGLYHKQRIVVIDGEPLLRHTLYTNDWMVHADARDFMKTRERGDQYAARFDRLSEEVLPGMRPAIDEITKRLKLEYYGIDCCLRPDNRQMVIFEANANMNVLYASTPASHHGLAAIENKIYAMLTKYSGEQLRKTNVAPLV